MWTALAIWPARQRRSGTDSGTNATVDPGFAWRCGCGDTDGATVSGPSSVGVIQTAFKWKRNHALCAGRAMTAVTDNMYLASCAVILDDCNLLVFGDPRVFLAAPSV